MKKHISIILALLMLAGMLAMPTQAADGSSAVTKESSVTGSWCDITVANLSLDAMCYIYFGYENTTEMNNADDYGVIFWTTEQEDGGYTYLNAAKTGSGALIRSKTDGWTKDTNTYTYFNYGVSMKQMTDLVWGQGYYIKDGTVYTSSKVVEYSVQTYAGKKLGFIGSNKTTNPKLETLLTSLLQTGAAAQEYHDYKTYDLASDILHWSEGLEYYKNYYEDGTCYVSSIGSCNDTKIFIPKFSPDGDKVVEISGLSANTTITSVVIPTSVKQISYRAFYGCTELADIRIHDKVELIGEEAFVDTAFYKDASNWDDNALYLGNYLIAVKDENNSLTEFTVKDGTTMIADNVFQSFNILQTVNIPSSLRTIGAKAFDGCAKLTNVNLAKGSQLQSIYEMAFRSCKALKAIDLSGASELQNIYDWAFYSCPLEAIDLSGASELQYIGSNTFYWCKALNSITLPDSLTCIYSNTFESTAYYDDTNNWSDGLLYIGNYFITAAKTYDSATLTIAEGTLLLADGCFNNIDSSKTTSLTLPSTLRTCDTSTWGQWTELKALETITVAENNEHFYVEGNCLIDKATGTVLFGTDSAVIPTDSSITAIGEFAFYYSGKTAITIPDNIKVIGTLAFGNCTSLTTVTISENSELEYIGNWAFYDCTSLSSFTFPKSLKYISDGAFEGTSITVPTN